MSETPIRVNVQINPIELHPHTAVLCGLILNELASNCLRHAFPNGRTGRVDVRVEAPSEDVVRMTVRDNGVGVPDEFAVEQLKSLGLKLVNQLSRQLKGTFDISHQDGMTVAIEFPIKRHR
jgi:two-component sensor histidine kinase